MLRSITKHTVWIVLFRVPSSRESTSLHRAFSAVAGNALFQGGALQFSVVNCAKDLQLCERFDIQRVPAILTLMMEGTGALTASVYTGRADAAALSAWVTGTVPQRARIVDSPGDLVDAYAACKHARWRVCILVSSDSSSQNFHVASLAYMFQDLAPVLETRAWKVGLSFSLEQSMGSEYLPSPKARPRTSAA